MHGLCGDRVLRAHRNFSDVDLRSVKDPKTFGVQMKQYLMMLARIHDKWAGSVLLYILFVASF